MADAKLSDSVLGLFLQFSWMLGGNAILAIAAAHPLPHNETIGIPRWRYLLKRLQVSPTRTIVGDLRRSQLWCQNHERRKTMNKGTIIFFGAIGIVFVSVVLAIGKTFAWW